MENEHGVDWDPTSATTRKNQRAAYDQMRQKCPVARSGLFGWSLFRHEDVLRAVWDHETFSNAVSEHLSVPNGMDPPEHTPYRQIIEPYFAPEKMEKFETVCRELVRGLLRETLHGGEIELMRAVALPFAVRVQCAFLGWPRELHGALLTWVERSQHATLAQERKALSEIAREFERIIDDLIDTRRRENAGAERDVTSALMHEKVNGRSLTNEELASILRNWTAGEIGTISAAIGITVGFLAEDLALQEKLRGDRTLLPYAIDEILRIHGPLVANRRVTKRAVEIGGRKIPAGEKISLNWVSANRDGSVFEEAESFRFGRDQSKNLLYGAGIHVCPGAPLASLEMRVFLEEFLAQAKRFELTPPSPPYAVYPASGFSAVTIRVG